MDTQSTFTISDSLPTRAMAPITSTVPEHQQFIVGTCALNNNNIVRSDLHL